MKFKAITDTLPDSILQADYNAATKTANGRIGKEAVYFPTFPVGARYLALSSLERAWVQDGSLHPTGCCGSRVPVYVLCLQYAEKTFERLTFDRQQDADRALCQVRQCRPELPGAPERPVYVCDRK